MPDEDPEDKGESTNPFASMPFFGDIMRAMGQQGPLNWELASQFAALGAAGDSPDPEPDPTVRIAYDSLADIADLHVDEATNLASGTTGRRPEILTTTRARWAHRTLTDFRPLFTDLAASLASREQDETTSGDPFGAMLSNLSAMMAPSLLGIAVGSMVGALGRHALGQYEVPLARPDSTEILVVASSVDSFADDWEISRDDLRMWVLIHELSSHRVLSTPAVRDGLSPLISRHVAAFRPDSSALLDRIGNVDPSDPDAMSRIQDVFSDPMTIIGAVKSNEQAALEPLIDAHLAAVSGYIDYVVDSAALRVLGGSSRIAEAVRRRRAEYGTDARLIELLLGINVTRAQQIRGRSFVEGVVDRAGRAALARMLASASGLPTPNEVDAPGLWLARIDLDGDPAP